MAVITGQMVSAYANYLLARIENDEEAPITPAVPALVAMDGTSGTFRVTDSDGTVLKVTIRPAS